MLRIDTTELKFMKVLKNPWTALYPCPVVLVTCIDSKKTPNIITLAWNGIVCSDPPTIGISIRPHRYSFKLIEVSGEFAVNIPSTNILRETDYCGVFSGENIDKFSETKLTPSSSIKIQPPLIKECPVNMECISKNKIPLGSHHLFLGEIVQVHVDKAILDEKGDIDFSKASPFVYNQGEYWNLNKIIGLHGFSTK
jgi:flavin reductase (DIM6/NTAB) family NADH-FMN oxidoreductase RutF